MSFHKAAKTTRRLHAPLFWCNMIPLFLHRGQSHMEVRGEYQIRRNIGQTWVARGQWCNQLHGLSYLMGVLTLAMEWHRQLIGATYSVRNSQMNTKTTPTQLATTNIFIHVHLQENQASHNCSIANAEWCTRCRNRRACTYIGVKWGKKFTT